MKFGVLCLAALAGAVAAPLAAQSLPGAPAQELAQFGGSIAVGEGEVFVGEPGNVMRPGLVYIYRQTAGSWTEQGQLQAPDAQDADGFGASLAVSGEWMLVGARPRGSDGSAHVMRLQGGAWAPEARLTAPSDSDAASFGAVVALGEGTAFVGSPGSQESPGAVHVFRRGANGSWDYVERLAASDPAPGDGFGGSILVDGNRIFVGASGRDDGAGAVHVLDGSGSTWSETARFSAPGAQRNERFGASLARVDDRVLVGAPGTGQGLGVVYAFRLNETSGQWQEQSRLFPYQATRQEAFGSAVAVIGGDVWVGSPRSNGAGGAAYVYSDAEDGPWSSAVRLASPLGPGGQMGATLAGRGDVAAAGVLGADYGAGRVVVFQRGTDGEWAVASELVSPPERFASITGAEVKCSEEGEIAQFGCQDVELLSFLSVGDIGGERGVRMNDVWGWTDPETNREYVIAGRMDGTAFVDITDPLNPVYLGNLPRTEGSPGAAWRDMKVYQNHAYIVADASQAHGVQVFDLTRLRNVQNAPVEFTMDAHYTRVNSVHNIVINEETGFAYAVGSSSGGETCGGGLHMIDIREPKNPTFAGCFSDALTGRSGTGYTHDAQCVVYRGPDQRYQGKEICFNANETALSIADVSDKSAPVAVSRAAYPNVAYSHQGWLDEEQRYFYMNDELDEISGLVQGTRTIIWDVSDLEDPRVVGEHTGSTGASDHNLYIIGDLMYQSNYQSGLRILDISDRENPVEVAFFDTVPYGTNTPGFGGSWSNYPYFPSGSIAVTSGGEGLFILKKRPSGVPVSDQELDH